MDDILKSVSISSLESPASIPFHAIENQDAPTTTTTGNQMPPSTGISICCGRTRLNSNRSYPKQQQWLQRTPETVMPLDRRGLTGEPANNRSIQFHLIVRRTASSPRRCGGECTLPDTRSSQPSHSAAAAMSATSIFNSSSNSNCRRHSGLIILPSTTRRAGFVIRWFPRSETGQTTMDRRSVCFSRNQPPSWSESSGPWLLFSFGHHLTQSGLVGVCSSKIDLILSGHCTKLILTINHRGTFSGRCLILAISGRIKTFDETHLVLFCIRNVGLKCLNGGKPLISSCIMSSGDK